MTAAPPAQLAETTEFVTRDGTAIMVRPACAGDEAMLVAFFDRVNADDRRFRFLAACQQVSPDQLAPLTQADHWQSESFLGFDKASGELVASALLACDAGMDTGEIAVSIRGDWRGRGVGWAMLDLLANAAQQRGLKRVISIEDRENHAAIELEREKGFTAKAVEGDPRLVMLEKRFD